MRHENQRDDVDFADQEDGTSNDVLMVKSELRKTIQSRREAKGLGSVEIDNKEETKTVELTPEEEEKVKLRRERNRLSAQKCRKRRREELNGLSKEANTIEEANNILEREIESLKLEKEQLARMLREHCCNMKLLEQSRSSSSKHLNCL